MFKSRCNISCNYILYFMPTTTSRGHFIPVLTAGRQSRRLRRPTDKSENGGSSIFRHRTESVEPAADWTEKDTIDICLSTENAPFQPCILLPITRYNDYVMRPRSYSRGLRNRKTYANANANLTAPYPRQPG